MTGADDVRAALRGLADQDRAASLAGYFDAGPGGIADGDTFLGVRVPEQRGVARAHRELPLADIAGLLADRVHEHRLTALLILVDQHRRARRRDPGRAFELSRFYLRHRDAVDHWDLVDTSARSLVGDHIDDHPPDLLDRLVASARLWDRRIALLATFDRARQGNEEPLLRLVLATLEASEPEPLIHKAAGWMLRELGEADPHLLVAFVREHGRRMPRPMLRTAVAKVPEPLRGDLLACAR